jgi:dihydroflavonol-4-reductase
MRVFLTGGTGYIGGALARRLAEDGHEVRALVRPASNVEPLKKLGIERLLGDVCDRPSVVKAMTGADWVIHAAGALQSADKARMFQTNVVGSHTVASAAHQLGVEKFLSVSSTGYFGGSPVDGSLGTEAMEPLRPFPSQYCATKHAGEKAIRKWAERGLWVNTVYPSLVYGEQTRQFLVQILANRIPVVVGPRRRLTMVYITDLVDGMVKVLEKAPAGRDYLMTGDVTTLRSLADRVCRLGGVRPPWLSLPISVANSLAQLSASLCKLLGRQPPVQAQQFSGLGRHWAFDDTRARTELGWTARSLDEGLPLALASQLGSPH